MDLADPTTFARAFEQHERGVYGAALRILGNPAQAQDVVQDVFLRVWRRPGSFDARRGELGSYLRMMARSRALDLWREGQAAGRASDRLQLVVDGAPPPVEDSPAVAAERGATRETVSRRSSSSPSRSARRSCSPTGAASRPARSPIASASRWAPPRAGSGSGLPDCARNVLHWRRKPPDRGSLASNSSFDRPSRQGRMPGRVGDRCVPRPELPRPSTTGARGRTLKHNRRRTSS